jgi:hypothetical protein
MQFNVNKILKFFLSVFAVTSSFFFGFVLLVMADSRDVAGLAKLMSQAPGPFGEWVINAFLLCMSIAGFALLLLKLLFGQQRANAVAA